MVRDYTHPGIVTIFHTCVNPEFLSEKKMIPGTGAYLISLLLSKIYTKMGSGVDFPENLCMVFLGEPFFYYIIAGYVCSVCLALCWIKDP
ncbi:MAG: hypothetical protein CR981_03530 [Proteobacteria bacterium]|nr:MAG: hypothetical protein CR981_03530 [Pseudomonadota bacterium]